MSAVTRARRGARLALAATLGAALATAALAVHVIVLCSATVGASAASPASGSTAAPETAAPDRALPARIVSLAPSVTETLFALGAGPRVVAVSDYCDYPPEAAALPRIGSFLVPNVEAIIALRPDVVIGTPSPGNHEAVAMLRRLGIRVEIDDPEHLSDLPRVTRMIAGAAGVPAEGERLVASIERDLDAVRERVAGAPLRRVLMVVGQDPLIAVGHTSFLGELLAAARVTNVAPPEAVWPHLNVEFVIAADPEIVIDSSMGSEDGRASAAFWSRFSSLAAVREGHVYPFKSYRVLRPGPRLPAAFADLARLVHPERWS